MRPAQCPFAKEVFSEDETIFLVRSPKDKYDVDSVDMGLCLREVQHAQARTGSQCAASDMNCVPDPGAWLDLGLTSGFLHGLNPGSLAVIQSTKQLARKWREEVYSFPCFCCFLSTGRVLISLVASPINAETTAEITILSLAPPVMTICFLNTLVVSLGPFLPSLCWICPRPTSA